MEAEFEAWGCDEEGWLSGFCRGLNPNSPPMDTYNPDHGSIPN